MRGRHGRDAKGRVYGELGRAHDGFIMHLNNALKYFDTFSREFIQLLLFAE